MKWCVLLLALAGVVFSAYATTSPPINVSITITSSGGTPCDVGPNYTGAVPAAATQAGFTHCAANYDFTQTQSFTDSLGTWQWSNISGWFSCSKTYPYLFEFTGNVPCDGNHFAITTDGGVQVLALSYYKSDRDAGKFASTIQTADNGTTGASFPLGHYTEAVIKVSNTNPCGFANCIIYDTSTYSPDAFNGSNPCFIEMDSELWSGDFTNTGVDYWNPTCGTSGNGFGPALNSPAMIGPSTSTYTTYGILTTTDNVNTYAACTNSASGVVNGLTAGAFNMCATESIGGSGGTDAVFNARNNLLFIEGPQSSDQGGLNWNITSETTTIQRYTIWVCPSPTTGHWQTGQCYNNPVITTHP